MKNIFGEDGLIYRVLNRAVDLVILNVLFLVSCIPVITAGAALTALYSVTLKMCRNEESYIARSYLKYFRENLKKSTLLWLICMAALLVLVADFMIFTGMDIGVGRGFTVPVLAAALVGYMMFSWIFPLTAQFENTVGNTLKNSLIVAMTRIGYTVPVTAVNLIPFLLIFYGGEPLVWGLRIYLLLGFALGAYLNSFLIRRAFGRYMKGRS